MNDQLIVKYKAEATAREFHSDPSFVRGIMGPVGCGKTSTCCMEILTRAIEQKPNANGVRNTRWALIRNTYQELISTTLKTWEEWVPREFCQVSKGGTSISGTLSITLGDGTRVNAEVMFLALDLEEDIRKLKGLELTGAFLNEASQIRKSVLELLTTRLRYPAKKDGGATWKGIIMDTNPPDDDHWWYQLAEIEQPKGYRFFKQPPALIRVEKGSGTQKEIFYVPNDGTHGVPPAENAANYDDGFDYWLKMVPGKDHAWIKVFVLGEYGSVISGRPVYPEYSDSVHLSPEPLKTYGGLPLILGFDFGLTPACIFAQQSPRGQLRILAEKVSEGMGIERFTRDVVRPFLAEKFAGMALQAVGDPAGGQRAQTDEVTCFQLLAQNGIAAIPAPSNSPTIRRESVAFYLTKLTDGVPGFLLDPGCNMLRRGFMGKYQYRRMKISGGDRYAETPDKNEFSHPHDALQYLCSFLRSADMRTSDHSRFYGQSAKREVVNSKKWEAWD